MALVLVIGAFTACGAKETKTVEQIIAENEEVKTQIESLGEADDMEASISGNTITYTVKLDAEIPEKQLETYAESFKNAYDVYSEVYIDMAKKIEEEAGTDEVTVKVIVMDAADKTVFEQEYTKNGAK